MQSRVCRAAGKVSVVLPWSQIAIRVPVGILSLAWLFTNVTKPRDLMGAHPEWEKSAHQAVDLWC